MLPSRHIIASFALGGGLWICTRSLVAGLLCFLSGVLADVDHIIDYVINAGLKGLNLKKIYLTCLSLPRQRGESRLKKVYLIFHAWEIVVLFWMAYLLFRNIYLLAIALGYTVHILMDSAVCIFHPLAYFVTYRLSRNFKTTRFFHS